MAEDVEEQLPDVSDIQEPNPAAWMLAIPGKDAVEYPDAAAYIAGYKALVDQVATAGKASATTRLAKIKQLRDANDATIHRIPTLERIQITAHLAKYQGTLEEKAKAESAQV